MDVSIDIFARVARKIDPRATLVRAWAMQGGSSTRVMALELRMPDSTLLRVVVRQHGDQERALNPTVAADEFRLLQILRVKSIAAPAAFLLDDSGEIFPDPYIVIGYIEGATALSPTHGIDLVSQMAEQLAKLHQLDETQEDLAFLSRQNDTVTRLLRNKASAPDQDDDDLWLLDTLQRAWPFSQNYPARMVHGDFWFGNVLWYGDRLAAIIDWENALLGDPLMDVGNARLEILWTLGQDAMQAFTQHYRSLAALNYANLPYWDLYAALRLSSFAMWAESAEAAQKLREHRQWFIKQASERLSAG